MSRSCVGHDTRPTQTENLNEFSILFIVTRYSVFAIWRCLVSIKRHNIIRYVSLLLDFVSFSRRLRMGYYTIMIVFLWLVVIDFLVYITILSSITNDKRQQTISSNIYLEHRNVVFILHFSQLFDSIREFHFSSRAKKKMSKRNGKMSVASVT